MVTPGNIYTDQTGRFPITYRKGTKYVFVLYSYEFNTITPEPLKDRTRKEILCVYKNIMMKNPIVDSNQQHIGCNKESKALKTFDRKQPVAFQFVPPHIHSRNTAERSTCMWKNQVVAGLCGVGKMSQCTYGSVSSNNPKSY